MHTRVVANHQDMLCKKQLSSHHPIDGTELGTYNSGDIISLLLCFYPSHHGYDVFKITIDFGENVVKEKYLFTDSGDENCYRYHGN